MEKQSPEKKFSTGAIQATVWKNTAKNKQGENVDFRTVSFGRRYKDKTGDWKTTTTLRINDLPKAVIVLNKAYEYLVLRDGDSQHTDNGELSLEEELVM